VQRNVYATVIVNGLPATLQVTSNAASATIRGAEMEGAISPFKAARFSLTYSYLDAHYDHYVTPIGQDFTSHPFEYTPRHKISLDQLYHLPSGGRGDLTFRATVSYQSSISVADDPQPYDTIPGYSLVNLRLDWKGFYRNSWSEWDASLFGTNVGNREYRVYTNPTYVSSGLVTTAYGEPRMWGVSLRARF
jgi:iron complex outermembrane receptor protein